MGLPPPDPKSYGLKSVFDLNVIYGQTMEKYYVQGQVNGKNKKTVRSARKMTRIESNKSNAIAAVAFAMRFQKVKSK